AAKCATPTTPRPPSDHDFPVSLSENLALTARLCTAGLRSCGFDPRPSIARVTRVDHPGRGICAWLVNRSVVVAQRARAAAGARGDDLGTDGDRGLFGRAGADVEADRRHDPTDRLVRQA